MTAHKLKSVPPRSPQAKPHPDFPLYFHKSGQWAKKILGRTHYFGQDAWAALDRYRREKDDLLAGRSPTPVVEAGLTVHELVNRFLYAKEQLVESGDIKPRTLDDYLPICKRIKSVFGGSRQVSDLRPDDFRKLRADFAKTHGATTLWNDLNRARGVFKFADDERLIDRPVYYGQAFDKPVRSILRREKQDRGPQMFTPAELGAILGRASPAIRLMTLLGVQGGLGNTDVALLKFAHLDGDWVHYPRNKTGVPRSFPLWPETQHAWAAWQAVRPRKGPPEYVFVTAKGNLWERRRGSDDPVAKEFAKVVKAVGASKRGFYCLRRCFETIGGDSRDQIAVDFVMGHAPDTDDMRAVYRQMIKDGRIKRVVDYVRDWLFTHKSSAAALGLGGPVEDETLLIGGS